MKTRALVGFFLFAGIHSAHADFAGPPSGLFSAHAIFSDSGVVYVPYSEILANLAKLAIDQPKLVQHVQYGTSVGGKALSMARIADSEAKPAQTRFAVQISGAIHGNEYLGFELELIQKLAEDRERLPGVKALLAGGGVIYAIPVLNPDGYSSRGRGNARGVDLNRDFDQLPTNDRAFTQPETRELARYIDEDLTRHNLKLQFSLDYHCCGPSSIIPWSYENRLPEGADFDVFKGIGEIAKALLGFKWGNPSMSVGYTAENSSVDYFYAKYGTFATAVEGRYRGEKTYLEQHVQLIDRAIARAVAAAN